MRKTFNLDKGWRFSPEAIKKHNQSHVDSYATSKAGGCSGPAGISYDDSEWRQLNIPHDRMCETEFSPDASHSHGYKKSENLWYRKTFKIDEAYTGWHFLLCFEGISVFSEIYVNGSLVRRSYSAYCEIPIDVTDRIQTGDTPNVIAVHIDGYSEEGWWYEGAGIYRHVKLYAKPPVHFAHNGLWVKPVLHENAQNDWTVEVAAEIENSDYAEADVNLRAYIEDADGRVVAEAVCGGICGENGKTELKCRIPVSNPKRWDVNSPDLYYMTFELYQAEMLIDEDKTSFGFRTVAIDSEQGFFLNGRHIFLKGTCNHQDHAGVGVAVPDSVQEYRIKRLKDLGCNAYRCSHNMPAKEILDACDKFGMIVIDENRRFESSDEVIAQVRTLVKRDRNHPCVAFYSLFNEEPLQNTPEGKRIFKRLRSEVKRLDDTRFIMGAINGVGEAEDGTALEMDVTGINYAITTIEDFHKKYPKQPIIGAENNSTLSTRGCYATDMEKKVLACYDEERGRWGQTARETWEIFRDKPYISGMFTWTGFDYRGEPTPFQYPAVSSQFGVMDTCGFAKGGYYFHQSFFLEEPMMHILPHWNYKSGDVVRVMAVTNCQETELFLNGQSLGRKKSDVCVPCEWQVPFESGILTARGYNGNKTVIEESVETTGVPYAIELEPQLPVMKNDGAYTVPVNVYAIDEKGRRVPTASDFIEFEAEGDGIILGVGNGDPLCHESDCLPQRSLFAGCCQVLVQSKEGAAHIKLIAKSESLKMAEYEFHIENTNLPLYLYNEDCHIVSGWTVSAEKFVSRPEPEMKIADDDMNSFEPVDLKTDFQSYSGCYKMYRAFFTVSSKKMQEYTIVFPSVIAETFEIFINGVCCANIEKPEAEQQIRAKFTTSAAIKNEIRVICKAVSKDKNGIKGTVVVLDDALD